MAVFVVGFFLILTMAGSSDANYCVCKTGSSDLVLQKNIDYACGVGADCAQIQQNGPCYNPNTVKDHCDYAVNSYYQKRGQAVGSCDFLGTATVTATAPSTASGCAYPSVPSTGGTPIPGTPSSGSPPTTGTPTIVGTPSVGTPGSGGTPNIGGTTPMTPAFGLGPSPSGFQGTDNSAGMKLVVRDVPFTIVPISVILINGLIWFRI
ncbi:hypothetical protein OROGR_014932 [Orobanche gracilis]